LPQPRHLPGRYDHDHRAKLVVPDRKRLTTVVDKLTKLSLPQTNVRAMTADLLPDPDWYLDNVLLAAAPIVTRRLGPIGRRADAWKEQRALLGPTCPPALLEIAERQGLVTTRAQARAAGISDARVRSLVRRRQWSVPHRGVLSPLPDGAADVGGRCATIRATAAALLHPGCVISHRSAAAVHGLPLFHQPRRPELTVPDDARECTRSGIAVRAAALAPRDAAYWFGAAITSVARTVTDLARNDGIAAALVAADAALAEGTVSKDEIHAAVERAAGWPGVRQARFVARFADGLAESPLESLTRLCLADGGLPPPELQVVVVAEGRQHRTDMLWRSPRVVLEADGRLKYTDDALWQEKLRQERLERAGYRVVRVTWSDVTHRPAETVWRVRCALALASGPVRP
jgi:hypothetical protein